jgi:hypothetical protein
MCNLFYFPFIPGAHGGDISIPPIGSDLIKDMCCRSIDRLRIFIINLMGAIVLHVNKETTEAEALTDRIDVLERPPAQGFGIIGIGPCRRSSVCFGNNAEHGEPISDGDISKIHIKGCCRPDFHPSIYPRKTLGCYQKKRNDIFFHVTKVTQEKEKVKK